MAMGTLFGLPLLSFIPLKTSEKVLNCNFKTSQKPFFTFSVSEHNRAPRESRKFLEGNGHCTLVNVYFLIMIGDTFFNTETNSY